MGRRSQGVLGLAAGVFAATAGSAWAAGPTGYVTNYGNGTVTPFNLTTKTADPAIGGFAAPDGVAVTPNDKIAVVTALYNGTVSVIKVATNTVIATIPPQSSGGGMSNGAGNISISPSGQTAWLASDGFPDETVTQINLATDTADDAINVGSPGQIAITPDSNTAYVLDGDSGTVTPIDAATNTAGTPISVGSDPDAIAITPNGKTAYVANNGSSTITPINTATNTPETPIHVASSSIDDDQALTMPMAITPNGETLYVANGNADTVTPISTTTDKPGTAIAVGTNATAVAITPSGNTAYVANSGSNTVTPINIKTKVAATPIPVGSDPGPIEVGPKGSTVYVLNAGSDTVTPITASTATPGTPIPVGTTPAQLALQTNR